MHDVFPHGMRTDIAALFENDRWWSESICAEARGFLTALARIQALEFLCIGCGHFARPARVNAI